MDAENGTARSRSTRRVALVWGSVTLAACAAVAAVALAGGFGAADRGASEVVTLESGAQHAHDRFAITVVDARLGDEIEGAPSLADDERVLAIDVDVVNLSGETFASSTALRDTLVVPALGDASVSISRADDGERSLWVQPEIPTSLMMFWPVPANLLADGDELEIELYDPERYELSTIGVGTSWDRVTLGARVTVLIDDADSGVVSGE